MSWFGKLFGKKSTPVSSDSWEDDIQPNCSQPISGPPEFVHASELQRAYWTYDAQEQAMLESRASGQLEWRERLRLHHLNCLQLISVESDREAATKKCCHTVRGLISPDSPYRPRAAMVWQGQSAQQGGDRKPDMQGVLLNPSLTHLGCLEVYRVDAANQPTKLDFVSFDELSGFVLAPPSMLRAAKLFYDDGQGELVLVPLLYGLTWSNGNEYDRTGSMTRFVAHLQDEVVELFGATGIGVGQQDLLVRGQDGAGGLFGLGSVAELSFPLDMRDPRFDAKARARGIDPDEVRRNMGV